MTTNIGSTTDYTVKISDKAGVADAVVYAWYMKPDSIRMYMQTPASIESLMELDQTWVAQLGKLAVVIKMRNILIDSLTDLDNLKKALMFWATSNGGDDADVVDGYLLDFVGKDVNGSEWTKMPDYDAVGTLDSLQCKIIKPIEIEPLPSGKYMINYLEVIRVRTRNASDDV